MYPSGGSTGDFILEDLTNRVLRLRNKPNGLDRELIPEYSLAIAAVNSGGDTGPVVGMPERNNTLYVSILCYEILCLVLNVDEAFSIRLVHSISLCISHEALVSISPTVNNIKQIF